MKILKICCSEWKNESRDKRELSVCRELGMDVQVLAKGEVNDKGRWDEVDGYEVRRYTTKPFPKLSKSFNRMLSLFMWAKYARELKPDVISGHDLPGLTIGWMSTWFIPKNNKPKLIYDSHEFELGRNATRSKFTIQLIKLLEHAMIKRSSMVMMVNDSIADEVQKIYKLKERPIVVRNIPEKWEIDETVCQLTRTEILSNMIRGGKIKLLLMYHGLLGTGRGLETLIEVVSKFEDVGLIMVGDASVIKYRDGLFGLIERFNVSDRVIIRKSVSYDELWKYVGAADIGMITVEPISRSYYYGLPNKLFENIQAQTPIIASNIPEMAKLVKRYNLGWIVENGVDSIVDCLDGIVKDIDAIKIKKKYVKEAKEKLCWEDEKKVLKDTYQKLIP